MHLAIHQKTGLVTFHGPVMLSGFTPYTIEHFKRALFETEPIGSVTNPSESNPLRPNHTLRTVKGGKARGPLVAGNLTLISTTMGTPYEIDTRGKILCIDARNLGSLIPGSRKQKQFSDHDVDKIAGVYREFRRTKEPNAPGEG